MSDAPVPVDIQVCATHGLRYNAATHDGCARCRKEAGEQLAAAASVAAPTAPTAPVTSTAAPAGTAAAPAGGGSIGPALGVTLLLILGAGGGLYGIHAMLYRGFTETMMELDADGEAATELEQLLDELGVDDGADEAEKTEIERILDELDDSEERMFEDFDELEEGLDDPQQ